MSEMINVPETPPTGKKYSLVVGVNSSGKLLAQSPLRYAEGDAEGISWLLQQQESGFESFQGGALNGSEASTREVSKAVNELIKRSQPEDLLLFYFIGCIYVSSTLEDDKIYLVTADFDPDDVTNLPDAHLSLDWIRRTFLGNEKLNNVIVILDCYAIGDAQELLSPNERVTRFIEALPDDLRRHQKAGLSRKEQSPRSWAIIVSTAANAPSSEWNGHTRMTDLILDVLKGKDQTALDRNGDLTLPALRSYLQRCMPEKQIPMMKGTFSTERHCVLVHNPVVTDPDVIRPDATSTPVQRFFDETTCQEATVADLDMDQIGPFLRRPLIHRQDDYRADYNELQLLEAFGLLPGEHPSYGALLCFGHRPSRQIAGAYTRCIYWRDSKRLRGWLDEREYRGNLLEQFAQAYNFLVQHLGYQVSEGDEPEPGKLYARVLEEALANALIHREYVREPDRMPRAEGVMVEIFRDRIEILSPGGPPLNIAVLRRAAEQHPGSHPRNPQIMRIFYLAGHVDHIGTGIARMQQWMQEAGLLGPDMRLDEQTQTFTITLHRPVVTKPEPGPEAIDPTLTPARDKGGKNSSTFPVAKDIVLGGSSQPRRFLQIVLSIALSIALVFGLGAGASAIVSRLLSSAPAPTTLVPASTTIEIASELPTSGNDTTTGLPVQNGIQMAIDDTNNNNLLPGYTLKLIPYNDVGRDNRHDTLVGVNNLNKAIADNLVAGVIGPYNSGIAVAELPIANQAPIALISPSNTYPCLTKDITADSNCSGSSNIEAQMRPNHQLTYFRLSTTDDREGKAAADFFVGQHYHKVLLLKDDSDPYSSGLAQSFQQEWAPSNKLVDRQVVPLGLPENASSAQDYRITLQTVSSLQPDLIYFAGNDPNGSYVLQALSSIPQLKSIAFAGASGIMDDTFRQMVANLHRSAPIYVSSPIQDPAHSGSAVGIDFESNYVANGYLYYRPYAAAAYDATKMLIQAIQVALQQKGVSTPHGTQDKTGARQFRQAILQALAYLKYTGTTGTQSFDANGDTTNHTISFYRVDLSNSQASWTWLQQVSA